MKIKQIVLLCVVVFLFNGCAFTNLVNEEKTCWIRGGNWTDYDAIGKKTYFPYCKGATETHAEYCKRLIKRSREPGSYSEVPYYCK